MSEVLEQFYESMGRRDDAFSFWKGADFLPVAKKVLEIEERNLHVREYRGIDKEGREEIFLRVYDRSKCVSLDTAVEGEGAWTFNVSHPCPPDCPNGD